jgi:hypothetical protein
MAFYSFDLKTHRVACVNHQLTAVNFMVQRTAGGKPLGSAVTYSFYAEDVDEPHGPWILTSPDDELLARIDWDDHGTWLKIAHQTVRQSEITTARTRNKYWRVAPGMPPIHIDGDVS